MTQTPPQRGRFYSLDVLRGLAALAVVFSHWHVFFPTEEEKFGAFIEQQQPFYSIFRLFYTDGWLAVDLFFCLSGFIFFWLYSRSISEHGLGWLKFSVLRFSRLYPLHFVTLLVAAVEGWLLNSTHVRPDLFPNNDWYHFVLNLVFASQWGFERGLSFNGPSWSLSVEVLLYAVFFAFCVRGLGKWWHLGLMVVFGYLLIMLHRDTSVGRGLVSFFMGGLSYQLFSHLRQHHSRIKLSWIIGANVLIWIAIRLEGQHQILWHVLEWGLRSARVAITINRPNAAQLLLPCQVLVFPAAIISLALIETAHPGLGKPVSFLGDISYSVYLIHFPLMIAFLWLALGLGLGSACFYSPSTMLLYFSTLIALSLGSHYFFERPAQSFLRRRFLRVAD
jgi:peptidoglycan/LPS O-acetylase OafA/YrhL